MLMDNVPGKISIKMTPTVSSYKRLKGKQWQDISFLKTIII